MKQGLNGNLLMELQTNKPVITNPISNIPLNEKSHTRGWSMLWKEQLNVDIDHRCSPSVANSQLVYIDHGANFGGTLNLFGGATKEVFDRINRIISCKNIVSLDWDMPDYGEMLFKRIKAKTTYAGITEQWCHALSGRLANVPALKQEELSYDDIILGDSHTIAFSNRNTRVLRNDGKTLYGALKAGLPSLLRGASVSGRITLCFGSIDIRHHLLRRSPTDLDGLLDEYVSKGNALGKDVWYCTPVPVEYEGRRIPQSGYFKKEPFYGSWEDRRNLTNKFIEGLYKRTNNVVQPPKEWYTMDSEKYANTFMEYGGSFHIAPSYYNRNDWGRPDLLERFM